jgi:hypothetical protein
LIVAVKVVFGVSLAVASFALSDAKSCDVLLPSDICPWDHRSLAVAWVAMGVALSAGSVLLACWVSERQRRLATEKQTRADILKWRAEHEVSP